MAFDAFIFQLINNLARRWQWVDWLGVFFGDYLGYFLILAAAFLLIKETTGKRQIYFFSLAALSVIFSRGIVVEAIRFFYERPRPFLVFEIQPLINHQPTGSFPSGHAAAFFALALAVFYINKKWGWRFLAAALIIGLARIFTGVHWPLDILAGALIGLLSAFFARKILPK